MHSGQDKDNVPKKTQAELLIASAADAAFFHDEQGDPWAIVPVGTHHETLRLRDRSFKRWLVRGMYTATGKTPNAEALAQALTLLERGRYSTAHNGHSSGASPDTPPTSLTTSRMRTGVPSPSRRRAGNWCSGPACFAAAVTPRPKWSRSLAESGRRARLPAADERARPAARASLPRHLPCPRSSTSNSSHCRAKVLPKHLASCVA